MTLNLRRHVPLVLRDHEDSQHIGDWVDAGGHPPLPEPDATALSGAAVTDLHRRGRHDHATALAVFLYWCDAHTWEQARIWQLEP